MINPFIINKNQNRGLEMLMVLTKSPSNQMAINLRTLFKDVPVVGLDRFIIVVPNSFKQQVKRVPTLNCRSSLSHVREDHSFHYNILFCSQNCDCITRVIRKNDNKIGEEKTIALKSNRDSTFCFVPLRLISQLFRSQLLCGSCCCWGTIDEETKKGRQTWYVHTYWHCLCI